MANHALLLVGCLGVVIANAQNLPKTDSIPPKPYIGEGACPFECCTYRDWTAKEEIALVDQPNGKKIVAQIHKGEMVHAVTGEVHSIPLRVVAALDHSDAGIKAGDVIYILYYIGEGYWKVWHNGG